MLRAARPSSRGRAAATAALAALALGGLLPAQARWNGPPEVDAFLAQRRERTLAACVARGITLPSDFVAWVDADPLRLASVYGCRAEPLPVLLALRSLEIDLGIETVRRDYPQLALAFAIEHSHRSPRTKASGWNDGDIDAPVGALPDVTPRPPLALVIPGDPRVPVDTHATDRPLDRDDHIVNFLEDHAPIEVEVTTKEPAPLEYDEQGRAKARGRPVAVTRKVTRPLVAADVIADPALQREFHAYMHEHGHPEVAIDCGDHVVHWQSKEAVADKALRQRIAAAHELFLAAYRAKGRLPAERDRAPTMAESMAWFVRNDREQVSAAAAAEKRWRRFPLNAPWPLLLMLAADDQPLREREPIWTAFRDEGVFRTYGEYIGGIAQQFDMQSARRVSPFAFDYGSIQMMWKDGGVCGTMGNIGARTWRSCGVPASTAGQPGHCALVRFEHDAATGAFRCVGEQYATGGDEVTTVHAGWHLDDVGGRRPMVFWQSVAWGVSRDFAAHVAGLVELRRWRHEGRPVADGQGAAWIRSATARDPFALPLVAAVFEAVADRDGLLASVDAFRSAFAARIPEPSAGHRLYRDTVDELAWSRMAGLIDGLDARGAAALHAELERRDCRSPKLLAAVWRAIGGEAEFTGRCVAAVQRYVGSAARTADKQESKRFVGQVQQWERSVRGKRAKQQWAEQLLAAFAGHEALRVGRKKAVVDPAVAALCKTAGREPPRLDD